MIDLIKHHRAEIVELCRRYGVARLDVFGSAAQDRFDPSHSDIDLLVEFSAMEPKAMSRAYFNLLFTLEALLGRSVDLVCATAMRNPYFIHSVEKTRTQLYAA